MTILQTQTLTLSDESQGKIELPKVDEGFQTISIIRSPAVTHEDGFANIRARTTVKRKSIVGLESGDKDEDPGLQHPGDYRTAQVFSGWSLAKVSFQSLGVIYGDIGTSPLYVYSSTFTEPPTKQDLVGVLSLILWSLILMVTVKYVIIVLNADNDGEGGTFSTYSLLCRYLNITDRDPREKSLVQIRRMDTGDLESTGKHLRRGIETSKIVRTCLKIIGVFAVTMVLSDGVLTPAQSVLGAIQGIQVAAPNISKGTIIGATDAILVILFLVQPLGISRITIVFAPIVAVWLALNAVFGIYNLVKYDASVLKAFYPYYAFDYLIRHKEEGWRNLGGVLLAFTGVEALFADLGAFSKRAIRISWFGSVFPCLVLAYVGQAAYISEHPEAYSNPFFNAAPSGTLYPALVIAILAAVVASQAIITASFQLLAQVMKLSYFPQLTVIHTSKVYHGQLYIPVANWLLMIGTVLVASIYNNTTSLGNAYGVCVMFVTFFDTLMVTLVAIFVWGLKPFVVVLPWLVFASLDATFLSAVLTKVPEGAWLTLTISVVLATIFLLWRYGKEQQWKAEAKDRFPTSHFIAKSSCGDLHLTDRFNGTQLSTIRGLGIFFDKAGETTPVVFSQFVLKLTTLPEVMIFFHLRPLDRPFVPPSERYTVSRLAVPSCYRVVVRYGFNDNAITPDLGHVIYQQVRSWLMGKGMMRNSSFLSGIAANHDNTGSGSKENGDAENHDDARNHSDPSSNSPDFMTDEVRLLDKAFTHNVLFITGKEQMKIGHSTSYFRATLLWAFLWIRDNTRNRIANLKLPADQIVEVGFLKEI